MEDRIREILAAHGRLLVDAFGLDAHTDLYQSGLTSHATVDVMLALEESFGTEFPERMLRKQTFGSVAAIEAALRELLQAG